jgi:UDP-N-acetylmuramate--alanine ligase
VVAVFQPHRYSRTKELAYQLGKALAGSDFAVVADVYSAGEAAIPGISGLAVAEAAREFLGDDRVLYQPSRSELAKSVARIVRPNDLVVTLGAGDITALFWEIKEFQSAKE